MMSSILNKKQKWRGKGEVKLTFVKGSEKNNAHLHAGAATDCINIICGHMDWAGWENNWVQEVKIIGLAPSEIPVKMFNNLHFILLFFQWDQS